MLQKSGLFPAPREYLPIRRRPNRSADLRPESAEPTSARPEKTVLFLSNCSLRLPQTNAGSSTILSNEFNTGLFEGFPQFHNRPSLCG